MCACCSVNICWPLAGRLTAELELHDLLRLILRAAVDLVAGDAGMVALAEPGRSRFG
jgi:hypothetical protein